MVDWAELKRRQYESATPEQRALMDEFKAREARYEANAIDIQAKFERLEWEKPVASPTRAAPFQRRPGMMVAANLKPTVAHPPVTVVASVRTKSIRMRLEDPHQGDSGYEILRFIGGPTGHEAYRVDPDFCATLFGHEERERIAAAAGVPDRWYICAGTPGSWEACSVSNAEIESYLRERRPEYFPEHSLSPR